MSIPSVCSVFYALALKRCHLMDLTGASAEVTERFAGDASLDTPANQSRRMGALLRQRTVRPTGQGKLDTPGL